MYAIIEDRGNQFKVEEGDCILTDHMDGKKEGDKIDFDKVLLKSDGTDVQVGTPAIENACVKATVVGEEKGEKGVSFKFKRRKDSKRKIGYRTRYTKIKIDSI